MNIEFNLAQLKRAAKPVLGFTPTGHNDGGTLYISCGTDGFKADKLAESLTIAGTTVSVSKSERLGSFAQQAAWEASGQSHEYYLSFSKPSNTFTKRHEGEAVVYNHPDGGSVSAIIERIVEGNHFKLRFAVPYKGTIVALLPWRDRHRLTLFGNSKFLCL